MSASSEEVKKRHKQEQKELNARCTELMQGKKGPERKAAESQAYSLKKELMLRHDKEVAETERALLEQASQPVRQEQAAKDAHDLAAAAEDEVKGGGERKLTRAQQRFLKKQEEDKAQQQAADAHGRAHSGRDKPSARDMELKVLTDQVARLGLEISMIPPNGDCLYGAVAHQRKLLDGESLKVQELRELAAATVVRSPALFAPFLPEDETVESFCKKIRTPAEWGGELELRALALGLRRPIFVHNARAPTVEMCKNEFPTAPVYHLTFHEQQFSLGEHYNSAAPVEEQT